MALTATSVTPTKGLTAGRRLVSIAGTDFDQHSPDDPIPMKVRFGGEEATAVKVISSVLLTCITPEHDPGVVDVEVENLVNPATATLLIGYEFERPSLVKESALAFVVRTLILKLQRQIIPEVVLSTHTDFDSDPSDGLDLAEFAEIPAIALIGPRLSRNRFHSSNSTTLKDVGGGISEIRRPPRVVDLTFDYILADNHPIRMQNLIMRMSQFFETNPVLEVPLDPLDASKGKTAYDLEVIPEGDPDMNPTPSNSNIITARGGFLIRGVPLEEDDGLGVAKTKEVLDTILETEDL